MFALGGPGPVSKLVLGTIGAMLQLFSLTNRVICAQMLRWISQLFTQALLVLLLVSSLTGAED